MRKAKLLSAMLIASLLSGCNSPEEKEARYIRKGREFFEQGEYGKARIEFKNAIRIKPVDAEPLYRLGLVEEEEGNLIAAYADFTHAVEQDQHYNPARAKIAEYYIAANMNDEAQHRLDTIIAEAPDFADAYAFRAALALRAKKYDEAGQQAHLALAKKPDDIIAYSVLANMYNIQGDMTKAIAVVDQAITSNPHDISPLLLKASFYEQAKDYDKAADAYQAIFKLRPHEKRYRVELAQMYVKAGQTDQAESTLRDGVAAMPDDWDMKKQLVSFLADRRGVDAAEKQIHEYMQAYPQKDDLIFWLTELYMAHNESDKAVDMLQQIAAKSDTDKQSLSARALLARISLSKGDKDKAKDYADQVLSKDPANVQALLVHAGEQYDRGQYDGAIIDLRTIIRDNPQALDAYSLLAEVLVRQGHLDLAADTLKQQIEHDPLNIPLRVRLAEIEAQNGNAKVALEQLEVITKANPKFAPAWEAAARISIDAKDWLTARATLDALDSIEGQHQTATYLRGDMLLRNNEADDALKQFKDVVSADISKPAASLALQKIVAAYLSLKRIDDAVHYLQSLNNDTPLINTLLAECYLGQNQTVLATASLDKAIGQNAQIDEPYLLRARIYLAAQQTDQAIALLQKATQMVPNDIRAPLMQAEIFGNEGKYTEAIALYDDILKRQPNLDAVANNLAETIADYQYNDAAALDKARKAAERFAGSTNPLLLDTLAWVYYRQGNVAQAQTIMERALGGDAKVPPQIHYHYGAMLYKSGKRDQAKLQLQQATVAGAQYPGLDDATQMLKSLSQ